MVSYGGNAFALRVSKPRDSGAAGLYRPAQALHVSPAVPELRRKCQGHP